GVGKHGQLTKNSQKLRLVAVCDVDPERLHSASETLGVTGEPHLDRLLERSDIDSVIIATSAKSHAAIAHAAIQAGKHVLLEKPLADTATHEIHLALWLMGGEPEAAYGAVTRGTILGDETIQYMNLMVEYGGGRRVATILSSMFGVNTPNVIQIVGRFGSVVSLDPKTLQVVHHDGVTQPGPRPGPTGLMTRTVEPSPDTEDPTGVMLDHFADRITGRVTEKIGSTFHEGAYAIAAPQAMAEAARSGCRVTFPTT
ncbi:MAG TPA: Gfo/Idh/MocA family oxidoreductase, partial [Chloroflexota bacterium]|nr:Gfo/Idh/MocA family oxidoreductase [Chloroflexota bacterium]